MNENTKASMENAIGEVKFTPNHKMPIKKYTKSDSLFAFMYIALGYVFIKYFIFDFYYDNFGFVFPLYTIAYIFTVLFYAKSKNIIPPKETYFWVGVMLCVAFTFKLPRFFCLVIQIFVAGYFTSMTGGGMYSIGTSAYIAADIWNSFAGLPFSNFFSIFPAALQAVKPKVKGKKFTITPVMWGVILAGGALWIVLPLLIQADGNFLAGIFRIIAKIYENADISTVGEILFYSIFTAPVACYLYGLTYGSMSADRIFQKDNIDNAREKLRVSSAVTIKVFLYIICAVYMLFIALQAEYLLGAFMGRLYSGMTYAQYARTGFFELCKVATINLSLLAICNLLIKKEAQKNIKAPMFVLCTLSLLLLSTAMAKMIMYICAYGLTEKRIISTVFLIWLVFVFVRCIARLYKPFNITKTAVITGAVMFCILFSCDIASHCETFNNKYGFVEKVPSVELYYGDNSLHLPDTDEVEKISVRDSHGNVYDDIVYCGEIMDLIMTSSDTQMASVQDFPDAEFYYILDIYSSNGNIDTIFIYRYSKTDNFYIEQPYNVICRSDFNWNSILSPYKN